MSNADTLQHCTYTPRDTYPATHRSSQPTVMQRTISPQNTQTKGRGHSKTPCNIHTSGMVKEMNHVIWITWDTCHTETEFLAAHIHTIPHVMKKRQVLISDIKPPHAETGGKHAAHSLSLFSVTHTIVLDKMSRRVQERSPKLATSMPLSSDKNVERHSSATIYTETQRHNL